MDWLAASLDEAAGSAPPEETDEEPLAEAPEAPEPSPEADETPEEDAMPEDEPLWARLARQRGETLGHTPLAEPAPPEEAAGDDEPLWRRFAAGGTAAPPAPEAREPVAKERARQTLHEAISAPLTADAPVEEAEAAVLGPAAENRAWYIEHLFDYDEDAYDRVIGLLARSRSWTDATQIIGREVFRRYKVNIYSEPAVSFTEAVEAQLRRD